MLYNLMDINMLNSNMILDIIGLLSIISAVLIIVVSNPMYSILYLILLFINISLYLYFIGISIMSLLYLLVYIGAIAILFLFILSLFSSVNTVDHNSFSHTLLNIGLNNNINSNNYPLIILIVYFLYKHVINLIKNIYSYNNYSSNISYIYENN